MSNQKSMSVLLESFMANLTDKMAKNLGLEDIEGETYEEKRDRVLKQYNLLDLERAWRTLDDELAILISKLTKTKPTLHNGALSTAEEIIDQYQVLEVWKDNNKDTEEYKKLISLGEEVDRLHKLWKDEFYKDL